MNKQIKILSFILSLTTLLVAFDVGDEIELDTYLNARTSADFRSQTKNVKATLKKGTRGEITEVKKFETGNAGIKMLLTTGPLKGKTYWVYLNKNSPALKLINAKKEEVVPEKVEDASAATTTRDVGARRDPDEAALEIAATEGIGIQKKVADTVIPQKSKDCPPDSRPPEMTASEEAKKPDPIIADAPAISPRRTETIKIEPKKEATPAAEDTSNCPTCYSPQKAIADINSGALKFVGRELMPGSGQNYTCIYKNEKVFVLYNNCMASKVEAPATDIQVISPNGDLIRYYVENFTNTTPISETPREKYSGTWTVEYTKLAPLKLNSSIAQIKKFIGESDNASGGCWIGEMGKAQDSNTIAECHGTMNEALPNWKSNAESFWKTPGNDWAQVQLSLRSTVKSTKF